ncbi:ADP-dependent glucokinase/phosphofructokinase [Herbiconiux ginsengi]|uniref:ADP-dependent phosphofructokinase/glucokinase n=1 Tax=Herbiconiux ginsengi TaxID=381665 RepID=A0A1H3RE09_9MICO|nr:ADP-dependent glucokinase/phosphofructokinase [Herbiconiux ginsengi]SDZ23886.1 ADP-dependent phosphofructokinase/glucokinase [Herbiconiux ginsengi]
MSNRIVLGLGGTVDYEIDWNERRLDELIGWYGIQPAELSRRAPIESERDLVRTLAAFLADGTGGERFVASSDILEQFAARFDKRITLGGTCVRAAIALDRLGVASTVHLVSIDDHVRRLLPASVEVICSADHDTTDPHLIVQYPAGASVRVGDSLHRARHPNRIIFTNDPPNRSLVISPDLRVATAVSEVFLVSGFNTIQSPDVLADRLDRVAEAIAAVPDGGVVVYEDAGYHLTEFTAAVRERLLGSVDLWSMNEDELQHYLDRTVDLLDRDEVHWALLDLRRLFPGPALVVHTRHWSAVQAPDARRWAAVVQGGITMASTRYLHGDAWNAIDFEATGRLPRQEEASRLAEALNTAGHGRLVMVPAFELVTAHPTTIGLGDSFAGGMIEALSRERATGSESARAVS